MQNPGERNWRKKARARKKLRELWLHGGSGPGDSYFGSAFLSVWD